jgi:hypothetical protein
MPIQLSPQTTTRLHDLAKILKIQENALLERAVRYYLLSLNEEIDLKKEFDLWKDASDEDLLNFEKTLI